MSLSNPNTVVTEQRLKDFYDGILPYLGGSADAGFTPVGTIIALMSNHAPANYLICDGTVYNIADYPELANHFLNEFGSKNKFGGNGTTTFAVPNLKGEFLRMTGTNGHTNQGSGANVGTHQDATTSPYFIYYNADNKIYMSGKSVGSQPVNTDSLIGNNSNTGRALYNSSSTDTYVDPDNRVSYTSRPTNTSVLYCIATKNIYLNPSLDYSTDEKVVGTWIDGKPLYQRTFYDPSISYTVTNTPLDVVMADLTSWGIEKQVNIFGRCTWNTSDAIILPFSIKYGSLEICVDTPLFGGNKTLKFRGYRSTGESPATEIAITIQYTKTADY